ncbi:endolytic transglycosylase MltG [Xylanibacillus composti]|nr:endolytic transglycosylase MltG [Xylanibacillus composti]
MPDGETGTGTVRRKPWKAVFIILLILFFLGAGTVTGIGMFVANSLKPVEAQGESITFTIEPGMNSTAVTKKLEEAGLIRSSLIFSYYLRYKGEGSRFQAGDYALTPGMTLDEMIAKFNAGDTIPVETVRFTVPEGMTVAQMAAQFGNAGIIDEEVFLRLVSEPQNFMAESIRDIPADGNYVYWLEGYLFPETYEIVKEDFAEHVMVQRMLEELDRKLEQLPEGWQQQMDKLGLTFHEIMTVASLIEREVVVDAERPIVAGVIYNRLEIGQPLQIDATVQYALGEHKDRVLYEDLRVDHLYNTYRHNGLPPGPIAAPGLASIRAALYPEETPYFYYVTKKDGSQEHLFAETYAQHLENIERSKQMEAGGNG